MESQPETQWDDEATDAFLLYGEAFVPYRHEQFRTVCTLIEAAHSKRVIDLCCGEGKLSRTLLENASAVTVEGFDASERMLESARSALAGYGERFQTALFDVHDRSWRAIQADAFVSSLALHHLTAEEKVVFYRDMFDALTPDGIFVNADLVLPPSSAGRTVAADAWDRWVKSYGESTADGGKAFEAFESLTWNLFRYPEDNDTDYPIPIAQELALMAGAGFVDVDVYWMYAGHAVWGGRKA